MVSIGIWNYKTSEWELASGINLNAINNLVRWKTKRKSNKDNWKYLFKCSGCLTTLHSGDKYIGQTYNKVCPKCAEKFLQGSITELEKTTKKYEESLALLRKNKKQWLKEHNDNAVLSNL